MQFNSGLAKFVLEYPVVRVDLQERVSAFSALSLSSVNLACAAGLIEKIPSIAYPVFVTKAKSLPDQIRPHGPLAAIALAARRLGAFFRDETLLQIEVKLGVVL